MTDPLRDIARQLDQLRKEQQARAVGHDKNQREIARRIPNVMRYGLHR